MAHGDVDRRDTHGGDVHEMTASDTVVLCQRLADCEDAKTRHETIYAVQRARVLQRDGEDWSVAEETIDTLDKDTRNRLNRKLTGLRDSLRRRRANRPGLAQRLKRVAERLKTASPHEYKRLKAHEVFLETKLRNAVDDRLGKLRTELRELRVEQLEWQVFVARVDDYIRRRAYVKAINLPRPKEEKHARSGGQ